MPELPEVETMRRGILSAVGAKVVSARRTPCDKKPILIEPRIDRLNHKVRQQKIQAIERLGKRVVIRFENDFRILIEPRMTGLVLIGEPPNREHLRFELKLGVRKPAILFWDRRGLGTVRGMSDSDYQQWRASGALGPDALDVSAEDLREKMKRSKQAIKIALLDQKKVLGVGNIYASEILHRCELDPRKPCFRLNKNQWKRVHEQMRIVLLEAIEKEGSTLSDGTYRTAMNDTGSYQNEHRVYDREGQSCRRCRQATIIRIVQAQRSTYFCPKCQKTRTGKKKYRE